MIIEVEAITEEQRQILRAAVDNQGSVALFRRSDTRGPAVRTPTRKFFNPRDPTFAQRYIDALKSLVEQSILRAKSAEQFELTNQGWEVAAKVGR